MNKLANEKIDEAIAMLLEDNDGWNIPVVEVKSPPNPTIKSLLELLLKTMGDPSPGSGFNGEKIKRLGVLMKQSGTYFILIDEFCYPYEEGYQAVIDSRNSGLMVAIKDGESRDE